MSATGSLALALAAIVVFAGCGASSAEATGSSPTDAASEVSDADAADDVDATIDCSRVGCSPPPLCETGCTAVCGCCSCGDGEKIPIEGGFRVCSGGCYAVESAADGG